jgi:glycosyltransferase involved in cell wall biosynthesis
MRRATSPKVSICVPTYQAGAYVEETIDSLLAQTYTDIEVVIVDNNSMDGTRSILDRVSDDRVRVFRNETTIPSPDNHNLAVRLSRGELVQVISADDTLKPECVAEQVAVLESRPDVVLVGVQTDFIDDESRMLRPAKGLRGIVGQWSGQHVVTRMVRSGTNPIGAPVAVMFRRADFDRSGGFRGSNLFTLDMDLYVRLLHYGDFFGIPRPSSSYRYRAGSTTDLLAAKSQRAQILEFSQRLRSDPRWQVSAFDQLVCRVNSYDMMWRRTLLFKIAGARAARRKGKARTTVGQSAPPVAEAHDAGAADTLSVVICAYTTRRWGDLCRAVISVLSQRGPIPELILVIDHSDELYARAVERFGHDDRVTVVQNTETRGLSGARNSGVRHASGDVVAFLDDDAVADPHWAQALMRHYKDGAVAGVGGYAAPVWPDIRPAWMPAEFDWVVGCSYIGQPTQLAPVRNPIGCNMSLRRSTVQAVGGFKSEVGRVGSTPVGGEETELCIRVRATNKSSEILFDPEALVQHHVSPDRATLRYFVRRCYHEGLSKAVVADLTAAQVALSSERAYVRNVLPKAAVREVSSMSSDGLARAGVMCLGLGVTVAGYVRAKVSSRLRGQRSQ